MSYDNFPSIKQPDYGGYADQVYKPSRRTEFDNNTIAVRPKTAFARRRFTLSWNSLPQADYTTLKSFFINHAGLAFNFTPYGESTAIACVFADDELVFTATKVDTSSSGALRWRGEVTIEEVTQ